MVQPAPHGFNAAILLLSSSAYPSSKFNSLWASNSSPNVGGASSTCIAEDVLAAFGIPYVGSLPHNSYCSLPGYDINGMDALQVLKLSLAAFYANGELWEAFADGYGIVHFVRVYPSPVTITLNVRMCIPNTIYDDTVHTVVVRGYDAPPIRHIKSGEEIIPLSKTEGDLGPKQVAATKCCILSEANLYGSVVNETTCAGRPYHRTAVISYKDPILQASYKDGVESIYEPKAFESIQGFIIQFDTGSSSDLNVTYQQSATTSVSYTLPFTGLISTGKQCAILPSSGAEYATFGYQKFILDTVEVRDRYGDTWPIFMGVTNLKVLGNTIQQALDTRAITSGGVTLYVDDRIVHISPPANKNWHWTYENGFPVLYVYSPKYGADTQSDYIWELLSYSTPTVVPYRAANTWATDSSKYALGGSMGSVGHPWPNLGAGIGTIVQKLVVSVDIDRPSIVVNDPKGRALTLARQLKVVYYPIVIEDQPPPIGYDIAGVSGQVDHTLDLYDNDPTTVQANPQTVQGSLTWLESQKTGSTIDISLPFLETGAQCESVAQFIYGLHSNFGSNAATSYNITCGPDDDPQLGAAVAGYDANLRINEVSYSYQDGSSYTVSATLGPVFESLGSWNTSMWQRKTEDVSRQGIITWSAGDGCTYRVRIRGIGEYYALNTTATSTFFPGEKVNVTIHNNPVEK